MYFCGVERQQPRAKAYAISRPATVVYPLAEWKGRRATKARKLERWPYPLGTATKAQKTVATAAAASQTGPAFSIGVARP